MDTCPLGRVARPEILFILSSALARSLRCTVMRRGKSLTVGVIGAASSIRHVAHVVRLTRYASTRVA